MILFVLTLNFYQARLRHVQPELIAAIFEVRHKNCMEIKARCRLLIVYHIKNRRNKMTNDCADDKLLARLKPCHSGNREQPRLVDKGVRDWESQWSQTCKVSPKGGAKMTSSFWYSSASENISWHFTKKLRVFGLWHTAYRELKQINDHYFYPKKNNKMNQF